MSEANTIPDQPDTGPHCIHFLLVPDFSMMAFVCAIEPLRVANRLSEKQLFDWRILTLDGAPVTASNGMRVMADAGCDTSEALPMLFVCAGFDGDRHASRELLAWLRRMAAYGSVLGAIDTGCRLLAHARLLDGYRVTLHWESISAFREEFPGIEVSEELFEIDRNRMTCAGGTAATDLMLHLIAQRHDQALAAAISDQFIRNRLRQRSDPQRMALSMRLGIHNPRVLDAVALMEKNIEQPLSAAALAQQTGVSLRQLERLFTAHLGDTPQGYYLKLRLTHARRLLQQTGMQVIAVAMACGFGSAAPLSRAYKAHFGRTPREDRHYANNPSRPPSC